jgi:hypothetical protein
MVIVVRLIESPTSSANKTIFTNDRAESWYR